MAGKSRQQRQAVLAAHTAKGTLHLVTYVPARPCVLKGPQPPRNSAISWAPNVQTHEPMEMFHIETAADGQALDTSAIRKPLPVSKAEETGDAVVKSRTCTLE